MLWQNKLLQKKVKTAIQHKWWRFNEKNMESEKNIEIEKN